MLFRSDFPEASDNEVPMNAGAAVLLGLLCGMTLVFGVYWGPLVAFTNHSLRFFVK